MCGGAGRGGWLSQRLLAARLGLGLTGLGTAALYLETSLLLPAQAGWWQEVLLDLPRRCLGTRSGQACV